MKQDAALVQRHAGRSRLQGEAAVRPLPRGPGVGLQLDRTCTLTAGENQPTRLKLFCRINTSIEQASTHFSV